MRREKKEENREKRELSVRHNFDERKKIRERREKRREK